MFANGGTVSAATLRAVSNFCESIDAAGLRSKMYRVNLFTGTQLAAALVPLYRSASFGGTAYGTSVDTNVNFVVGDYTEGAGLTGNGSNKYLNLGTSTNLMPSWATHHLGVDTTGDNNANKRWIGNFMNGTPTGIYSDYGQANIFPRTGPAIFTASGNSAVQNYTYFNTGTNATTDSKLKLMSRTSSTSFTLYNNANAGSVLTVENGTFTTMPAAFNVFAHGYQNVTSGAPSTTSNGYECSASTFRGYTIGLGLTAAQVTAYNTIWATFRTAMGRP